MANVNAHDAKKQRENLQASTDRIDLMGIAMMLLNLRAKCSPAQDGIYLSESAHAGATSKKAGGDEDRS